MALSKKMENALNEQINAEFYSAYLYLSMSAYCESIDLPGFANWMLAQSQEENEHGMRLFNFVHDRDGAVKLDKIDKPESEFGTILDMFNKVLEHEKYVTKRIHDLYKLAVEEADYPTQVELQWFIQEQVEEEKTAKDIIQQLKWIGDKTTALFMLDQKMGERQGSEEDAAE